MKSKELKSDEASNRQEIRKLRTPTQQLKELDSRLGVSNGAEKERAKLLDLIRHNDPKKEKRRKIKRKKRQRKHHQPN